MARRDGGSAPVRAEPMGEAALLVQLGHGISPAVNDRVLSLFDRLRAEPLRGVTEVVPAYATLLVQYEPEEVDEGSLRSYLEPLVADSALAPANRNAQLHEIPVRYGGDGGPDLPGVAEAHNITPAEVVRLHTGRDYRVYFLGFLPGFGYMGRLPGSIATPRLATPRLRVPIGAVGIANAQTGVYPFSSPGGWQIIGRTSLPMWDLNSADPALLAPGDSVRFVATGEDGESEPAVQHTSGEEPISGLKVVTAGGMAAVQDLGWRGYAHLGLGRGGVFDPDAAQRANLLVGNEPGAAVLELAHGAPSFVAQRTIAIALDGAAFGCRVDGVPVAPGMAWFVRPGSVIAFSQPSGGHTGARAYMAVRGGIAVPEVLGSRSTALVPAFGGYKGRPLQVGDVLGAGRGSESPNSVAGRYWPDRPAMSVDGAVTLRFVRYAGPGSAEAGAIGALTSEEWIVSHETDRMGTRLVCPSGSVLPVEAGEQVSLGVVRGAIQVPPDGNPILLNVDHQTTGGYPVLGVVARADWPVVAQLLTGDVVRFSDVSLEEARRAYSAAQRALERGSEAVRRQDQAFV